MMANSISPFEAAQRDSGVAEVDRLLTKLEENLSDARLSLKQQEDLLSQVKVLGRHQHMSEPIFSKRGISILSRYGFDQTESPETSHEALRCLANALLLDEPSRQLFVDLEYPSKAAERLKLDNRDDEFLTSRILFLLTYNTSCDFKLLINKHHLTDSINKNISRHADNFSKDRQMQIINSTMENMSMVETLKLLFNITFYHPETVPNFAPSVEPLIDVLLHHPLEAQPLQPPITFILNALLNLDLQAAETKSPPGAKVRSSPIFPSPNPEAVVERFAAIFDSAIITHSEKDLEQAAAPLCTLLRRAYELAEPEMKLRMQRLLLPTAKDRDKPLGQGQRLSSRLLRLSNSPVLPNLRDNIASLLFELSDKDPDKFVKNIGYGFASGFLMSHNIKVPQSAMKANSTSSSTDVHADTDVNPITGQRLNAESRDAPNTKEMTEEEKEREAERLFVLFERLRATGVVDVKNPVQEAIDHGRFEELDD